MNNKEEDMSKIVIVEKVYLKYYFIAPAIFG